MCEKLLLKFSTTFLFLLIIQHQISYAQKIDARIASTSAVIQISTTVTPPTCSINGTILVSATGGMPPYTYSFDHSAFQSSALGYLNGNSYTVIVKDAAGTTASKSGTVSYNYSSPIFQQSSQTPPSNCNASDGSITLKVISGTPPYTYSMDNVNFQSSNTFNNLLQGLYVFIVKDANGCTDYSKFGIGSSCYKFSYTGSYTQSTCANDGNISIQFNGGQFTYSLDGINYQNDYHFTGLGPGLYKIRVKDNSGNLYSYALNIMQGCPFAINTSITDASCGNYNGTITAYPSNGNAPYTYSIDGINFKSSNLFSGLSPGNYTIIARDAKGSFTTNAVTITNVCLSSSSSATDATCGNSNGTITANAISGVPPYMYSIDGINFQPAAVFSGVSPGSYNVTIKDASGTVSTSLVSVSNIPGPQITASSTAASCTGNDGSINLTAAGGTAPYLYTIDNSVFQNNSLFNHVSRGSYSAVVKDANGCLALQPVTVDLANNLFIDAGPDVTINEGDTATLNPISNGTSFSWTPSTALNSASIFKPDASPDVTTQYYVTAREGVCESSDSVLVIVKPAPVSDFFVPTAFTPNSDGLNDLFKVKAVGIRHFNYFAVFNRWGQRVFFTTTSGAGWNGTVNGKISPTGTYVWMAAGISFKGKKIERRGTVELIR